MNEGLFQLALRIRQELKDVEFTLNRAELALKKAKSENDDLYLDGIALNLHGFYSGIERLLERIAIMVDSKMPEGANWH